MLKSVYLSLRKVIVQTITVVKFEMYNRCWCWLFYSQSRDKGSLVDERESSRI